MSKLALLLVAAVAPAAALCAPAAAQDRDTPRATVRYDDLNLASSAGRDRLDARIRGTIARMCGIEGRVTPHERMLSDACIATAKRSVEPQMAALFNDSGWQLADREAAPRRSVR